jgi:predicted NAD/FAD-binding protein
MRAQNDLPLIQGVNRTWFCGAWCGFGFHEDGLQSALKVCKQIATMKPVETPDYERAEKTAAE